MTASGELAPSASDVSSLSAYKPDKPKFGGLKRVGTDSWAAWTGGKPKSDWKGLETPNPDTIGPNQYRTTSIGGSAKSQAYRIKGLEHKFTRTSDLHVFQIKVMKHLKEYGLDTITYMTDPADEKLLISVVDSHSRFTAKEGLTKASIMKTLWDSYDMANISDAKQFLLNSIDADLEQQLYEVSEDSDSFIAMWFRLIHIIKSVSIDRFETIKARIKSRKLSDHAGENIESLSSAYLKDWTELHQAKMYDFNLTLNMLETIMQAGAGSEHAEDFRFPLRDIKSQLNIKLLQIRHLSYADAHKDLVSAGLDVRTMLSVAKDTYRQLLDRNQWPAESHAKDSKAMNRNYGNAYAAVGPNEVEMLVNALMQTAGNPAKFGQSKFRGRKGGNQSGNSQGGNYRKQFNSGNKSARNNPGRKDFQRKKTGAGPGGPPPPKAGESEIKNIDGKKRYWCSKCNRWTISHTTDQHKSKEELQSDSKKQVHMARVDFNMHPTVYMANGPMKDNAPKAYNWGKWLANFLALCTMVGLTWMGLKTLSFESTVWLISTISSGVIGFGAGVKMFNHVPSDTEQAFVPQAPKAIDVRKGYRQVRYKSKSHNTRRGKKQVPIKDTYHHIPPCGRVHHPRFRHVSRVNRYTGPTIQPIRHILLRDIKILEKKIEATRRKLAKLLKELENKKFQLRTLDNPILNTAPRSRWEQAMQNELDHLSQQKCIYQAQRNKVRPGKKTKKGWVSSWNASMTIGNMVNLSSINSSGTKSIDESVLFDSGANCCVSNNPEDFVGKIKPVHGESVDGIGKALSIEGQGKVAWTFVAANGMYRTLLVPCFYIPSANTRIASLRTILKAYPNETITMDGTSLSLSGHKKTPGITVPFNHQNGLPFGDLQPNLLKPDNLAKEPMVFKGRKVKKTFPHKSQPSLTSSSNINLVEPEKELLRWHYRLGHIGMKRVQWLFRQGFLATDERTRRLQSSATKLTHGPMCTACQYSKQRRTTMPGTTKQTIKRETNSLKRNELFPGSEVSIDHFACNPLGRLLTTYGKEKADAKYKGGCVFVDHASGYIHVELQTSLNSHHTLDAKASFEEMCATHGVIPQNYLSDNGTSFVNKQFEAHLKDFHQTIRHSAVGAHHSNGIAERNIGTVLSIARALLHHAAIHWPEVANVDLWPLAVLHAVHILNRIPREDTGRSPLELFSRKTWPSSKFHDLHVWGCPVYVLDSTLSDGHKLPRWKPRSSRCVYVGQSLKHGHAVPLVLNLDTGKISPQFHVVFDDWFQTVDANATSPIDFDHEDWYQTFGLTESQYVKDEDYHDIAQDQVLPATELEGVHQIEALRARRDTIRPPSTLQREHDPAPIPLPTPSPTGTPAAAVNHPDSPSHGSPPKPSSQPGDPPVSLQRERNQSNPSPGYFDVEEAPPRRTPGYSDVEEGPPRSTPGYSMVEEAPPRPQPVESMPDDTSSRHASSGSEPVAKRTRSQYQVAYSRLEDAYESMYDYFVGKAARKIKDPDTYSYDEAMASPYREEFLKAAQAEIDALVEKGTWVEDLKSNATTRILPGTWVFKIKRTADGSIRKFKGRYCCMGNLQDDLGHDNFSPVAAWSTVRLFLVIAMIAGWVTCSIDFSNAFVQSDMPADDPVWLHVPRGFKSSLGPNYCLHLKKSLYGIRAAPKLWLQYSTDGFKKLGLKQSVFDPCLWYGDDIMLVQYVDDCGIAAPNQARIDQFVKDLKELGFELTQEDSFEEFLGIKFETLPDGSIECTQRGLIKKVLEAAGMSDCNPNSTPSSSAALGADKDGEPMDEPWNYRGICGMLLYLSTNTRPDIAHAVSQVCRFGHNPKKSHATAVKTILRYLKKTQDKGIIIKPHEALLHLNLYVDADFCGLFGREDPRDPNSVRSRTGYIVILSGWPIVWKSQLQSHLSQSTLEAEYSALSSALRVFLPLKNLAREMIDQIKSPKLEDVRLHSTVFEDNQSTYYLAKNQRITSRTKYLLAKWHWFWDQYNQGEFTIVKCPTDLQLADFLTKSQPRNVFEANRRMVSGW